MFGNGFLFYINGLSFIYINTSIIYAFRMLVQFTQFTITEFI